MKKKIAAAVAASALLLGGSTIAAAPAQASASTGIKDDKLFVKLVTSSAPGLKGIPRKTMVKTAKQTCKFLRNGYTILDAVDLMEESGFTQNESTAFIAGAIVFYCPEQEDNF